MNRNSRRALTATEDEAVQCVMEIVKRDGCLNLDVTVSTLPSHIEISRRSMANILNDKLGMTKICSRWGPGC